MWAVTIETNSKITVMAKNSKTFREIFTLQPLVKFPSFTNLFSVLRTATIDMIYGEKLNPGLTATSAFSAIMVYEKLAFFFALISATKISFFSIVSCPDVFAFGVSFVFFGNFFWICFLPSLVGDFVAFFACHSQLIVTSRVLRERFIGETLLASVANPGARLITSSIFGRASVFLQEFSPFRYFNNQGYFLDYITKL